MADPGSSLSQYWNQQHDRHVTSQIMEMIRPQYEAKTWKAFRLVALKARSRPPSPRNWACRSIRCFSLSRVLSIDCGTKFAG